MRFNELLGEIKESLYTTFAYRAISIGEATLIREGAEPVSKVTVEYESRTKHLLTTMIFTLAPDSEIDAETRSLIEKAFTTLASTLHSDKFVIPTEIQEEANRKNDLVEYKVSPGVSYWVKPLHKPQTYH